MLSQIQGLKVYVSNHLMDVIDWNRHVQPEADQKSASDVARILITTPFNRYKLAMGTAYAEPPAGAPIACRSVGWIRI